MTCPRLTTFATCLNAADVQDGGDRHDRYKRLSLSGYDVCFSTPSHSSCVVVDQSSQQPTCHEKYDRTTIAQVPSHNERLQLNTAVSGGSLERQRRLQLSQNPVVSLRRLRTFMSQSRADDDDDDVTADEVDKLHQFPDKVVVY